MSEVTLYRGVSPQGCHHGSRVGHASTAASSYILNSCIEQVSHSSTPSQAQNKSHIEKNESTCVVIFIATKTFAGNIISSWLILFRVLWFFGILFRVLCVFRVLSSFKILFVFGLEKVSTNEKPALVSSSRSRGPNPTTLPLKTSKRVQKRYSTRRILNCVTGTSDFATLSRSVSLDVGRARWHCMGNAI